MARHRPPLTDKRRDQWRPKEYTHAEKRRLVRVVGALCARLGRPVSAADLKGWFARHATDRPELAQRLGQQLLKAARPRPAPLPRLWRTGVHGSLAYYCAQEDLDGRWAEAFERYVLEERLAAAAKENFVEAVGILLGTEEYGGRAAHALAGWLAEAEELAGRCAQVGVTSADLESLRGEIAAARPHAVASFTPRPPADLIGRAAADGLLRVEFARRGFEVDGARLSTGRLFSLLRRWPAPGRDKEETEQPGGPAFYSRAQVLHLCAWRWPLPDEDPERSRAGFLCARHGQP